jgi:cytochrome c
MRRCITTPLAALIGAAILSGAAVADVPEEVVHILVLTETTGFPHASRVDGVTMFQSLAAAEDLEDVDFVVEAVAASTGHFTDANLGRFDVVAFISTTGNFLDATEQAAFERFIQAGGGYVGIHASSDGEYAWPWYGDLVGAYFKSHPTGTPQATMIVEDAAHASTAHLDTTWTRVDEWYNFRRNPRGYVCNTEPEVAGVETQSIPEPVPGVPYPVGSLMWPDYQPPDDLESRSADCGVHVLLALDESTYTNNLDAMGDHPIAWCHEWDGGRSFYTGLGHTSESFTEPAFVAHVVGGVLSAAGLAPCTPPTAP